MRYRIKRPFSRKIRVSPSVLVDGGAPPALRRFAADPMLDPLSGAIDVLLATYAGDIERARQVLARLGADGTASALSRLFAENEIRKLTVACFRRAMEAGAIDRDKAALLLDFARRFDPLLGRMDRERAAPAPVSRLAFDQVPQLSSKLRIVLMVPSRDGSPTSRPYEVGERMTSAFAVAGVGCAVLPSETDPGEIGPNDLVLIDEDTAFRKDPGKRLAHLDRLRKVAKRLGRLVPDPWGWDFHGRLARSADRYDFVWGMAPTLRDAMPALAEKFCLIPYPTGFGHLFDEIVARGAPPAGLGFCGAIEDYNIHRYFWLLSALAGATPLQISVTSQQPDGLGYEASLKVYLGRLLSTGANLSLTMRPTGDRIMVGRTFDVLRGERLLVQEATPDARHYLTPGEDFVEIGGIGELPEAAERIRSGACEAIRAQGAETFRRAYSDLAVVRHLATWV